MVKYKHKKRREEERFMDEEKKIERLRKIIDDSSYTVILSGSGMMAECGYMGMKTPEKAYEIENRYGVSPEDIFTSVYYNNRPAEFFKFYRSEVLQGDVDTSDTFRVAARMEKIGKLKCIITGNIYGYPQKAGCKNVIDLHGNIHRNICPHCGRKYPLEYIKRAKKVPLCQDCSRVIRPQVALFGEMMDSQLMTRATWEIENADTLILLGTTLDSEVFSKYIKYFEGTNLVIIHKEHHHSDSRADLVIWDEPRNVFTKLGY